MDLSDALGHLIDPDRPEYGPQVLAQLTAIRAAVEKSAPPAPGAETPSGPPVLDYLVPAVEKAAQGTGVAGQWMVGYGASQTSVPVVARDSRQAVLLPQQLRTALVGGVLTFQTGVLQGQSARIQAMDADGVVTTETPLTLSPNAGADVILTAAPGLARGASVAWLDRWIEHGQMLKMTSPWNGTIDLAALSGGGPLHLVLGYGFAGSVSGSAAATEVTAGANNSSTVTLSSPTGLMVALGDNAGVNLSAASGVLNVTLDVGAGAVSNIALTSASHYSTYAIGPAAEGLYTLGGYGCAFSAGRNDSSNVTLTANFTRVVLGDAGSNTMTVGLHNGAVTVGDGAGCIANVSGYNSVVTIGPASADAVTLTSNSYGATVDLGRASQSVVHIGASRLSYPVVRLGDGAGATISADAASPGAVGESSWWALYGQAQSLAAGSAYTAPAFDLTGWGPGNTAVAQVSGTAPWALGASAQVASGGPTYSLGSATATAGATLTLPNIPNVAGVVLTVTATGTAAVTLQDVGLVLTPPA